MRQRIVSGWTIGLALTAMTAVPFAQADPWNKKTNVTISGQLEVPGGVVLDSGKYVFKLADSSSNRHIVQIFNERENQVYATILAIPNYRQQPADKTVITTWETPSGQPPALRAWFYPGDNYGQEFAYPKHRATEIAMVNRQSVSTLSESELTAGSTEPAQTEESAMEERVYTDSHSPKAENDLAMDDTPAAAPSSKNPEEPQLMAQNQPKPQEPQAEPAAQQPQREEPKTATPEELPQTASPAAWFGLLGLASLGGATAIRAVARRGR